MYLLTALRCCAVLIFNLEPRLPGNERRMPAPDALGKSDGTLRPLLSVALRLLVGEVLEYLSYRDRVGFAFCETGSRTTPTGRFRDWMEAVDDSMGDSCFVSVSDL